ncbi:MAG: hypothetical protein J0647_06240 [Campylobacteraceae bacterium]|nr:hypothetical protein [Campylobacteraceae bacterium]
MSNYFKRSILRRFLRDLLGGEIVGASDGGRYGVSWLANYATVLRESYGVKIESIPKGTGLKHFYRIKNKERAKKVLETLDSNAKEQK